MMYVYSHPIDQRHFFKKIGAAVLLPVVAVFVCDRVAGISVNMCVIAGAFVCVYCVPFYQFICLTFSTLIYL